MRYLSLSIFLSIAVTVSAIDIRFHTYSGGACAGDALVCTNVNPGVCCYITNISPTSVGYYGVPTDWNLRLRVTTERTCAGQYVRDVVGSNFYCVDAIRIFYMDMPRSANYYFNAKKRHAKALDGEAPDASQECQKVDTFMREEGQKYDVSNMDDAQLEELIALSQNGTADLPEAYKAFEKNE